VVLSSPLNLELILASNVWKIDIGAWTNIRDCQGTWQDRNFPLPLTLEQDTEIGNKRRTDNKLFRR
jgi:hypothetical protein